MNWTDWYTDTVDVYRVQDVLDGRLTRHERVPVSAGTPCRIYRSGDKAVNMGKPGPVIRAFAADPNLYYEPFGAIVPGLAHQEIRLLQQERVKGGVEHDLGGAGKAAQEG